MSKIEILSQTAVTAVIASIKTNAVKLQGEIHQAAVSTLDHVREHGDFRGALALVCALPNGQRVEGLIAWYSHFSNGKLTFKKDQHGQRTCTLKRERDETDFDIEAAMLTDFGALTKEPKANTFGVDKLIKMLESKANNTETNSDGTPKVSEDCRAISAKLVASYRAMVSVAANSVTVQ